MTVSRGQCCWTYRVGVVLDRAVGRKVAHGERGADRLFSPLVLVDPELVGKLFGSEVGAEVVRDEVVVIVVDLESA